MQNIIIEEARDEDIPDICRIINTMSPAAGDYNGAVDRFRFFIKNNPSMKLWVASIAVPTRKIVGTAMLHFQYKLSYNCGIAAHLEDVVVDPDYRSMKVGEKLVEKAIQTAKEHDCYKIMLTCYEKTSHYYEKFGFVKHDIGMRLTLKDNWPERN